MMRPHPVGSIFTLVKWSDGSRTITGPAPTRYRTFGPLLGVEWSDGSSSWYLSRNLLRHGILGDSTANWLATLIEILQGQGAPETREDDRLFNRQYAIRSLEEIGTAARAAIPVLVEATKDDDAETRVRAAKALVVMGEQVAAVPVLERAVADQSGKGSVREMARRERAKLKAQRDAE